MPLDKKIKKALQQYLKVFQEARERNANEADTVIYLTRFITDVLGYDLFTDITKEFQIKERYCDLALKINGEVRVLVEVKTAGATLSDRNIEQAENYASRYGLHWVLLTNGIHWKLYHLTFDSGIEHDLAFDVQLTQECILEETWTHLNLLSRNSIVRGKLEDFWEQKKTLRPSSLIRALFTEEVINVIRRDLKRKSRVPLEVTDVVEALKKLLNPDVLIDDIKIQKKRKKKKKITNCNPSEVETETESGFEVIDDEDLNKDEAENQEDESVEV